MVKATSETPSKPRAGDRRERPVEFARLYPAGPALSAQEIVEQIQLPPAPADGRGRPYLLLNMVASADGHVTINGRSGPLGNRADYELFHALRTIVDGVMIGAGTLRTERYNRIVNDPDERALRVERGLAAEPYACLLSRHLDLAPNIPLLADRTARVVILTPSRASLSGCAAHVEYIRPLAGEQLDLPAALAELRERFAVRVLLCEGGPHLNAELLRAGLVDELLLTLAPKLAGTGAEELALMMIAGAKFDPPLALELAAVYESQSYLFLRYRMRG